MRTHGPGRQNRRPHPRSIARGIARALPGALVAIAMWSLGVLCASLLQGLASRPARAEAANARNFRNFYDVLEDTLGDFEFDLKSGNVTGLKNLSIRNLVVSENIPASFRGHLDLLLTERILKNTKAKVLQCLACRAKKTSLSNNQVTISSPETDPAELAKIAAAGGIEHFLDAVFTYQPAGLMLSMTVTEPSTGSIVWSRSYNSETSRAAAFRRGVDYSQTDDVRRATEYVPTLQYRGIVGYVYEPNAGAYSGCLQFGFRMVERYDNRKKEVGFEVNYLKDSSTLLSGGAAEAATDNLYSGLNLTLLFVHAWNFIGDEENFNRVRGSFVASVGGTYASGFLGGVVRGGWEWRLGKHTAVSVTAGYRPPATAFVGTSTITGVSVSGVEGGFGISLLF